MEGAIRKEAMIYGNVGSHPPLGGGSSLQQVHVIIVGMMLVFKSK